MPKKKALITGITGFLGEKLAERLVEKDYVVSVVARNEGKLIYFKEKFPDIKIQTGDVSDPCVVKKAMKGMDEIYHLAAFKHVGLAEEDVTQCISSNTIGSMNVLRESFNTKPSMVVGISTDKAAQVSGVYGATKLLMERLFSEAERINSTTKYRIVRYGNVLYSTGSVLCKWKDKMQKGQDIIITDPDATRFFWTVDQAVEHIFECIANSKDTSPYVPSMKAMRIGDLLEAMMQKYGRVQVEEIGLQPGENMHETIDGKIYSNNVESFSIEEIMKLI